MKALVLSCFFFFLKNSTQTGSFTSCPGAHDSFHCTKLFQQFLAFGKQPLFLFRGQIPASPGTPRAHERRRRRPGMELGGGGCCSAGCTCILGRNLVGTLLSFIQSLKKPSAARNLATSLVPLPT